MTCASQDTLLAAPPSVDKDPRAVLNYGFDLSPVITTNTNPWAPPAVVMVPWLASGEVVIDVQVTVAPSTPSGKTDLQVVQTTIGPNSAGVAGSLITAWLSGGTAGETYVVSYEWTTNSTPVARQDVRSITVICVDK